MSTKEGLKADVIAKWLLRGWEKDLGLSTARLEETFQSDRV